MSRVLPKVNLLNEMLLVLPMLKQPGSNPIMTCHYSQCYAIWVMSYKDSRVGFEIIGQNFEIHLLAKVLWERHIK